MKHKVTCVVCGKTERIFIDDKGRSDWYYFGKVKINACTTDKYFYRLDEEEFVKVKNECYIPKVKPVFMEYWECPECYGRGKQESFK